MPREKIFVLVEPWDTAEKSCPQNYKPQSGYVFSEEKPHPLDVLPVTTPAQMAVARRETTYWRELWDAPTCQIKDCGLYLECPDHDHPND